MTLRTSGLHTNIKHMHRLVVYTGNDRPEGARLAKDPVRIVAQAGLEPACTSYTDKCMSRTTRPWRVFNRYGSVTMG